MNICFFNVKECTDGKPKSGVERVASVLAAQLRSRGYYVEFYPPPIPRLWKREVVARASSFASF